jgi:hypothetical protein
MVIFTYVDDFLREGLSLFSRRGWDLLCRRAGTRRSCLSSSPLCFGKVFGFAQDVMTFRIGDFVKYLVHGFLNAGVRLMKLARGLRGQAGKAYTGSAKYVERQKRDQNALFGLSPST